MFKNSEKDSNGGRASYTGLLIWADLPNDIFLMSVYGKNSSLCDLVISYNKLPKSNYAYINERINILAELVVMSDSICKNDNCHKVKLLSEAKINYLEFLKNTPNINIDYIFNSSPLSDDGYKIFSMRTAPIYSAKNFEPFGKFDLEFIDPYHRFLTPYWISFIDKTKGSSTYSEFFLWLEDQYIPPNLRYIKYLNDTELANYKLYTNQVGQINFLFDGKVTPITTDARELNIFIVDLQKNIFLIEGRNDIYHSSLSRGHPVLASGALESEDGYIKLISIESGHYRLGKENFLQVISLFQNQGALISFPLQIIYFDYGVRYEEKVNNFEQLKSGFDGDEYDYCLNSAQFLGTQTIYYTTEEQV